ncbi:vanin-like protein 3 [Fopius arisanus]|uniref:Vanin-like protein 3 n=1 Tax=Fopius arisanus TaxID=64838 RepID=A0A9R1SZV2_9HYME|nr:PREDICTED: vanin-like protein 3 [Fopius arisanus]
MNSKMKQEKLCQYDFCCDFTIETSNIDANSKYKLMVVNSQRTFVNYTTIGYQACAIVLCRNESVNTCGLRTKSETVFSLVRITATFVNRNNLMIMPNSVNSSLLPLDWTYNEKIEEDTVHIEAFLTAPAKNVQTLGLFARKFERDVLTHPRVRRNTTVSSAVSIQIWILIFLVVTSVTYLLYKKYRSKSQDQTNGYKIPHKSFQQ